MIGVGSMRRLGHRIGGTFSAGSRRRSTDDLAMSGSPIAARRLLRGGCATLMLIGLLPGLVAAGEGSVPVSFNRDVRPILSDRCYACHGPDAESRKADLRLDHRDEALAAGAISSEDPSESELLRRVTSSDPEERMPPVDSGKSPLTESEIALLERWISQGAPYEAHWAYLPVQRPRPPKFAEREGSDWCRTRIDQFVLAEMRRRGLTPAPPAARRTLVRRLYLDLLGLPPSDEQVAHFLHDPRPDAYERLVDRLLGAPQFGERVAVVWLDLVRFANSVGYHGDQEHVIEPYREYVVAAWNEDMPFDQFTREQLAGDLLAGADGAHRDFADPASADLERERLLVASGYNRLLQTSHEGGVQVKEYLAKYSADRVRNVSEAWLGASVGCAECHDHKFDPYTQRDFYSLAAFFADIDDLQTFRGTNTSPTKREPERSVLSGPDRLRRTHLLARLAVTEELPLRQQLERQLARLEAKRRRTMISQAIDPRPIRVLARGNWMDEESPLVDPDVPAFLPPLQVGQRRPTRLDLANWLTRRDNPLTARVLANRLWAMLLGRGIADDLYDMGSQGKWPTHPELLDYLAAELMDGQWRVKPLLRQIVLSNVYRQSSDVSAQRLAADPQNQWYARAGTWRLPAEMVRDTLLTLSGTLILDQVGPPSKPRQPAGYYANLNFPQRKYVADTGRNGFRRGVYMHWQRQYLHPMLKAFDAPTREECTAQRPLSNTPQAALVLLNDPNSFAAALGLAARLVNQASVDDRARIQLAYRLAVGREPMSAESDTIAMLLKEERQRFEGQVDAAQSRREQSPTPVAPSVASTEFAAWVTVARVILNLQETTSRR